MVSESETKDESISLLWEGVRLAGTLLAVIGVLVSFQKGGFHSGNPFIPGALIVLGVVLAFLPFFLKGPTMVSESTSEGHYQAGWYGFILLFGVVLIYVLLSGTVIDLSPLVLFAGALVVSLLYHISKKRFREETRQTSGSKHP
ncbi:hypothetical protein ACLI4Z_01065 [Natrialbaceae archaeon A-arb3/5]